MSNSTNPMEDQSDQLRGPMKVMSDQLKELRKILEDPSIEIQYNERLVIELEIRKLTKACKHGKSLEDALLETTLTEEMSDSIGNTRFTEYVLTPAARAIIRGILEDLGTHHLEGYVHGAISMDKMYVSPIEDGLYKGQKLIKLFVGLVISGGLLMFSGKFSLRTCLKKSDIWLGCLIDLHHRGFLFGA